MCVECGNDVMSYFASSSSYSNTFLVSAFTISQKHEKVKHDFQVANQEISFANTKEAIWSLTKNKDNKGTRKKS